MENKIEMSAPLKELEDIFKAMTIQQAKDELEQKKRIEEHWQDIQRAQDTAIKETQEIVATTLIQVVRLFYALKQLDEAKECLTSPLLNSLKVLEKFQTRLFEVAQGAELLDGDDCAHSRKELFTMAYMLVEKSTSNVTEDGDITYKLIYDELDRVTHPFTCLELKDIPLFPNRFMLPPWVGGSSYPADLHMRPPPTQQVLSNIHASSETNLPAISQPDGKEDGKGGARRFGHSASGSTHDPTGSRVQHIPQVSHGHSGYARQLEVIYEVEEKDYIGTSNVVTHGRYVPYYPVPIYQEQEQLQAVDSNKSEEHDRVMACTVAESASLGLRLGVPSMSRSQSKQQGFGSSSVTTLHQQESTSSQNNDTTTTITNKESSSKSSNGGGVQARWSGRKKGRSQNRSPQGSTQSADARNLDQRPKESSAQMRSNPQQQQRRSSGNNDQYLLYLQHSLPRPHELNQYNITQNQRQYCRYTSHTSEQPVQQQQRCYNEEQELSHHSMQQHQQRQQDVPHFVQQPCYQYPVDRYFPGHGGGPVYYVQEQQEEHQR
ncbi:hypothetical protein EC991_006584 [Linnemannia zychae]|nr:hypothetical protein EC991_006584 [Linnemannia zychae]